VADRIRKQTTKIEELAADIKQNGLLNPITVMSVGGEGYQLLAGLRRLRAAQLLGWTEIDANELSPMDAEAALRVEFSENEQREPFTYSEKMDYTRLIEAIVKAKALERKSAGGKGGLEDVDDSPHLEQGKSRDIIGSKIGMSGKQYDRARYVADHAPPEVIEQLDSGERSISGVYSDLRAAQKAPAPVEPPKAQSQASEPASKSAPKPPVKKASSPNFEREPMPPPETDRERAHRAESELNAMKYRWHNEIYHRDGIIDFYKRRIDKLEKALEIAEAALETANARILELEASHEK